MKKIIFLVALFIITSFSVLGAELPRWVGQPIHVYIPEYSYFSSLMKQAFTTWENKSGGLVRFKFTSSPSNADIEVEFVDFVSNCNDIHAVGCAEVYTFNDKYYKAYVTIGTKQYKKYIENGRKYRKIEFRPKNNIYGVMLHEAGHAIGLGHSESSNSIMYSYDLPTMQYLTDEDVKILYKKYH